MSKKFYGKYKSVLLASQFTKENFVKKIENNPSNYYGIETTKQSVGSSKIKNFKPKIASDSSRVLSKTVGILPKILGNSVKNSEILIEIPKLSTFYRKIDNFSAPQNLKSVKIKKSIVQSSLQIPAKINVK